MIGCDYKYDQLRKWEKEIVMGHLHNIKFSCKQTTKARGKSLRVTWPRVKMSEKNTWRVSFNSHSTTH